MAGSGRQGELPLNNCAEAESAGSNPLSRAWLIITAVCLCVRPDDDDGSGARAADRGPRLTQGVKSAEMSRREHRTACGEAQHLGEEQRGVDSQVISKQTGLSAHMGSAWEPELAAGF